MYTCTGKGPRLRRERWFIGIIKGAERDQAGEPIPKSRRAPEQINKKTNKGGGGKAELRGELMRADSR